jgi:short-subunit dehydrogenase
MDFFKNKYALITGASSGIGYEFANLFAKDGANIVITARNEKKLLNIKNMIEKEYNVKVFTISKDLVKTESPEEIYEQLKRENISIDILVNNAGFGYLGYFSDTDLGRQIDMIRLNVLSLVKLTGLLLPSMIEKGYGKILNVASIAGFQGMPHHSIYSATKAFVLIFSESITRELEDKGITVTCLCPGPTDTNFFETAGIKSIVFRRFRLMSAREVAKVGFNAIKKNKTIAIPGLKNKLIVFLERFIPRIVIAKLAGKLHKGQHKVY